MEQDDIRSKELIRFEMEQRERDLKRRENEIAKREQEAENKEELLKVCVLVSHWKEGGGGINGFKTFAVYSLQGMKRRHLLGKPNALWYYSIVLMTILHILYFITIKDNRVSIKQIINLNQIGITY